MGKIDIFQLYISKDLSTHLTIVVLYIDNHWDSECCPLGIHEQNFCLAESIFFQTKAGIGKIINKTRKDILQSLQKQFYTGV